MNGSEVDYNKYSGILFHDYAETCRNNSITIDDNSSTNNNVRSGVSLFGTSGTSVIFSDSSTANENGLSGIRVYNHLFHHIEITNSSLDNNVQYGIDLNAASTWPVWQAPIPTNGSLTITGSTISGNNISDINVEATNHQL